MALMVSEDILAFCVFSGSRVTAGEQFGLILSRRKAFFGQMRGSE
jgi:hypothetical protein